MKKLNEELGLLVKEYRNKKNITQLELSEKLGYDTPQFVSIIERGLARVPLNVIGQLIVLLGIPEKKITKLLTLNYQEKIQKEIQFGKKRVVTL
ncbi:MAG: helix-turn-helix transcriptional regulator [Bdellovibrionota bacterium]